MAGLLPCPFCGDLAPMAYKGADWFCVDCRCGAQGPSKAREAQAIAAWNRRAPPEDAALSGRTGSGAYTAEDGLVRDEPSPPNAELVEADREVERIMAMSDEAILAECRARGEDPEVVAAEMRARLARAQRTTQESENG